MNISYVLLIVLYSGTGGAPVVTQIPYLLESKCQEAAEIINKLPGKHIEFQTAVCLPKDTGVTK